MRGCIPCCRTGTDSWRPSAASILNRALIVERAAAERYRLEIVNAVPQPKAGGSFAAAAYAAFADPVAVEEVRAVCGMDIGGTLIGMHLARVAVPVRLDSGRIGEASLICAGPGRNSSAAPAPSMTTDCCDKKGGLPTPNGGSEAFIRGQDMVFRPLVRCNVWEEYL